MATVPYITQTDVENFISARKLVALADDDQDGVADPGVVAALILLGSAEAESWVEPEYTSLFPFPNTTPIPDMLRQLTLLYTCCQLFERHPEYVRKFGEEKRAEGWYTRAERLGGQLQSHVRAFADLSKQAANVGGVVLDPGPALIVDGVTGEYVGGDF